MKQTSLDYRKLFSLLFIVGISVVFTLQFGPGSRGCEAPLTQTPAGAVATVNGKEIPVAEFRRAYRQTMDMYRQQGLNEKLARQMGLHKQVLDQLVNTELLAQAAEKHGVLASDRELADLIQKNPAFFKDGKFDQQAYRDTLRQYYRKTDLEFERDLRRQLTAQKMLDTVANTAVVSDDEVKSRFLKEGNKAAVQYVRFTPAMFADKAPAPAPADLASFKQAHQKEIEDYYTANKFLYNQPEQVKARHILIKLPENATQAQKDEAKQKIENLRKDIVDGHKDFAEMARQYSEDTGSKASGGELGFNTADAWVKPFSDAAFKLKAGEISEPVETQFGYHLIQVEEKKPPMNKPLKDVEDEIATQLWKKEKAKDVAKAEADKALAAAQSGQDLKTLFPAPAADEQNQQFRFTQPTTPVAVETDEFNAASESIPRLGPAPTILPEVFAQNAPGVLPKAFQVGDAWVVVKVTERKLPSDADYAKDKDTLRADARRAKEFELRDAFLKSLKKSADVKTNDALIEEVLGPVEG